ncbi:hypothetical protein [Puniceibacterium sediminis]|uniref:Uncharacterized protein n=1 Tax=Puniceibacterium sediminis TaxID=1608407 RepID=A0A238YVM6_9RHOB|nr:hypothetical protein [Puniceibacterium sediminis]SNR74992.1 hypothetical protein SAMN06265370_12044 [Puniceibacterium sediminis]
MRMASEAGHFLAGVDGAAPGVAPLCRHGLAPHSPMTRAKLANHGQVALIVL